MDLQGFSLLGGLPRQVGFMMVIVLCRRGQGQSYRSKVRDSPHKREAWQLVPLNRAAELQMQSSRMIALAG